MSTRGAWGFILDGKEYITYNHSDSYPNGLGLSLIQDFKAIGESKIREQVKNLILVKENEEPTKEQIKKLIKYADTSVSTGSLKEFYVLLRETQGDMRATLESGFMIDSAGFLYDSLFCEFAYIFNLDERTFEIYDGFQEKPHTQGRYHKGKQANEKYYPVALIVSFPLDAIPENKFVKIMSLIIKDEDWEEEDVAIATTEKDLINAIAVGLKKVIK